MESPTSDYLSPAQPDWLPSPTQSFDLFTTVIATFTATASPSPTPTPGITRRDLFGMGALDSHISTGGDAPDFLLSADQSAKPNAFFAGIFVGLIIRFGSPAIQGFVAFDHRYFFNLLLPPIILNSGYDMKKKSFFRYIGSIMTFALLGTFISTVIIGTLVYFLVLAGMHRLKMTMMDCLVFGAILSSTDPVAVLSLFQQMKVDPKLYAIIFGESILNDSVAIVLFSTLGQFTGKEFSLGNVVAGIVTFFGVFLGSILCGTVVSLIIALMLKHSQLYEFPSLESCLVIIMAYSSYLLSNGLQFSGIVSLLFCGIILKHYAYDNMSVRSRRTTKYMFRVLSQLSENFVFIYLGVTLFTSDDTLYLPGLIVFTLVFMVFARYVSVIPLANLINIMNRRMYPNKPDPIPRNHQLMLWWAGLRGAIAFALSFDVSGPAAQAIRTTTLVVCVISVIVLGGTTPRVIVELGIRTGVDRKKRSERSSSSNGVLLGGDSGNNNSNMDDFDDEDDTDSSDGDDALDWTDADIAPVGGRRHPQEAEYVDLSDHVLPDDDIVSPRSDDLLNGDASGGGRKGQQNMNGNGQQQRPLPRSGQSSSSNILPSADGRMSIGSSIHALLGHPWLARDEDFSHWFISFDNQWLKPIFTRTRWKWGRRSTALSPHSPNRHHHRASRLDDQFDSATFRADNSTGSFGGGGNGRSPPPSAEPSASGAPTRKQSRFSRTTNDGRSSSSSRNEHTKEESAPIISFLTPTTSAPHTPIADQSLQQMIPLTQMSNDELSPAIMQGFETFGDVQSFDDILFDSGQDL
ncbi:hypothetical protein SmJEL517_g04184 [Synchytrium microbalum]|uniref:Sodium/hydrogen exchanger n=1 Tax=Synchytrium microbalum TaxID=1806994 RepID=A0A507BZX0_9FUNG|nr:uncharacterized protein SmJEL517_g04184 [Synchytrium microbalum]TPX32681.1 hypothetical protein SmJEL517_g04184 [Synchytrium microbalum]